MVDAAAALIFPRALQDELIEHARLEAPDEACGMLAGRGQRIERVFRVRNTADEIGSEQGVFRDRETGQPAHGQRRVHYYMDPRDQLRVYNEIDELGLDLIGYYHSHTHTEARPSPTDIRLATDVTSYYILVSLENSSQPAVRAWRIEKADPMSDTGEVREVELTTDD